MTPTSGRAPGIYMDPTGTGQPLVLLEPTVFTKGKTGGVPISAFTYGLYKAKWTAIVRVPRAAIRTTNRQPTFCFLFADQTGSTFATGAPAGWLTAATSPNEFVLAQVTEKRNERELIVGRL